MILTKKGEIRNRESHPFSISKLRVPSLSVHDSLSDFSALYIYYF
jgi:hypothetical protein